MLKKREGYRAEPYDDGYGNMTSGYGHTGPSTGSAEEDFDADVAKADGYVHHYIKVPLTQYQHDALSSIMFNMGPGNFRETSLPSLLNAGKFDEAADTILQLNKAENKKTGKMEFSRGLADRGKQEWLLFVGKLTKP